MRGAVTSDSAPAKLREARSASPDSSAWLEAQASATFWSRSFRVEKFRAASPCRESGPRAAGSGPVCGFRPSWRPRMVRLGA